MYTYNLQLTTYGTYKDNDDDDDDGDDDDDDDDDDNDKNGDSIQFPYFNVLGQNQVAFDSNSTTREITKNFNKFDVCVTVHHIWK